MVKDYLNVYCKEYVIYLITFITLLSTGIILLKKYVKNEKTKQSVILISAIFLLASIIINRITCAIYDINKDPNLYSWINVLPHTFCGFSSLIFSLAVIFGKEDNKVLHFIFYLGLGGGVLTLIYPGDLLRKSFWDISLFTSLIHHSLMIWLAILLLKTNSFKPTTKKWYIYPIGFSFMMMFGLFEKDVLNLPSAMNIGEPLVEDVTILTSWWFIFIVSCILVWLFEHFYEEKILFKKSSKKNN